MLLDVEMKEMSGISLKEQLEKRNENIKILFLSSHVEMMSEAFGKNVYGFLTKPVDKYKLEKYIDRMLENMEVYVTIQGADGWRTLLANDILYFRADGRYCYAITHTSRIFCNQCLGEIETQLLKKDFVRCHRSIVLNLRNVKKVSDDVEMKNGEILSLARRKKEQVKMAYDRYLLKVAR